MKFYHATTSTAAESIRKDGVIKAGAMGDVFLCRNPLDACKFLILRGTPVIYVVEVDLRRSEVIESYDHAESFFKCKAYDLRTDRSWNKASYPTPEAAVLHLRQCPHCK